MNLYNAYFVSKGTGPRNVQIEALNQAGAKAQVEAVADPKPPMELTETTKQEPATSASRGACDALMSRLRRPCLFSHWLRKGRVARLILCSPSYF
jgi:hypothetical protein